MSRIVSVRLITEPRRAVQWDGTEESVEAIKEVTKAASCYTVETPRGQMLYVQATKYSIGTAAMRPGDWVVESPGLGPCFVLKSNADFYKDFKILEGES